ncbi:hypothetical protein NEAUS04_2561, partial [Nematocida ausubeli]
ELSADKAKIGGKSPRVMGVVSSGIETVQSALCGLMK